MINSGKNAKLWTGEVKSELQLLKEFSDEVRKLPFNVMRLRIKIHILNTLDVALRRRARRLKNGEKEKALRVKQTNPGVFAGPVKKGIPDKLFPAITPTLQIIKDAGGSIDVVDKKKKLDGLEVVELRSVIRRLAKIDGATIGWELRDARRELKKLTAA